MMNDERTGFSVTTEPCKCGYLQTSAEEPSIPIVFDEEMNEYHLVHSVGDAYSVLYHCPFCGGSAPCSKRGSYFATITLTEMTRLQQLTAGIRSVKDATDAWGPPQHDHPHGSGELRPGSQDVAPQAASHRTLTFTRLSAIADVTLHEYPTQVAFTFQGKYIGPKRKV